VEAGRAHRSWNVYYLPLVTKVGLFVAGRSEYAESQLARRTFVAMGEGAGLFVASPEDNVLFKLHWFAEGGEVGREPRL
jgi:hypothetical protein